MRYRCIVYVAFTVNLIMLALYNALCSPSYVHIYTYCCTQDCKRMDSNFPDDVHFLALFCLCWHCKFTPM